MMKRIVLLIVVMLPCSGAWAQYNQYNQDSPSLAKDKPSFLSANKFHFGLGGSLGFGSGYNYYSIIPIINYQVSDRVSAGAMLTYQRYNFSSTGYGTSNYNITQYGMGPFVRYTFHPLFIQVEYDVINAPSTNTYGELTRSNFSRLLIGPGYVVPTGDKSYIGLSVMYDVFYHQPSVFQSPLVVRGFFNISN